MLSLRLNNSGPLRILCLGAHCDDIEIGCGATILKLAADRHELVIRWVVFSSDEERRVEALNSAHAFLENVPDKTIVVHALRDGFFPYLGAEIKSRFEQLKSELSPDLILTHYRNDQIRRKLSLKLLEAILSSSTKEWEEPVPQGMDHDRLVWNIFKEIYGHSLTLLLFAPRARTEHNPTNYQLTSIGRQLDKDRPTTDRSRCRRSEHQDKEYGAGLYCLTLD